MRARGEQEVKSVVITELSIVGRPDGIPRSGVGKPRSKKQILGGGTAKGRPAVGCRDMVPVVVAWVVVTV